MLVLAEGLQCSTCVKASLGLGVVNVGVTLYGLMLVCPVRTGGPACCQPQHRARQSTPSRSRTQRLLAHEPLYTLKPTDLSLLQQVAPCTACAVCAVAAHKALVHLHAQHLVAEAKPALGSCGPGREAAQQDTKRLAHQIDQPRPRCFATKPNFTSTPSRIMLPCIQPVRSTHELPAYRRASRRRA